MPVPTTAYGVAVLLILVIPGIVYAAVRTAVRGHRAHDREAPARVLQALMVSALLDALYLLLFGRWAVDLLSERGAGLMERPRAIALAVLLLGIGVPAALAYLIHGQIQWRQPNLHFPDKLAFLRRIQLPARLKFMSKMKLPLRTTAHQPTPTAWDYAAPALGGRFVRIRLDEGKWVAGWYDSRSFISTYPEPRDIYLQSQWNIGKDGTIGERMPRTAGVWVALKENTVVEWIDPP